MRGCVRSLLLVACLEASIPVAAADGIYLPTAPTGPGGEDTIESSTGTRCRQSINSNGAYLDIGVVGSVASKLPNNAIGVVFDQRDREGLAYARITVPLGSRPKRIDCSQIYEMEVARLRREIELLKMNTE